MSATRSSRLPLESELATRAVFERLVATRAWLVFAVCLLGSAIIAVVERQKSPLGASDRALSGAALGVALPLLAYLLCDAALGRKRLSAALEPLARHGGNAALTAAGFAAPLAALLGIAGGTLAAGTTFFARGVGDSALLADLAASFWIGALGGAAYAACFALASSFGKRGGGRTWLLALDFLLGSSTSVVAVFWPRAHVRNLIGGAAPLDWSQGASAAALGVILLLATLLTLRRSIEHP